MKKKTYLYSFIKIRYWSLLQKNFGKESFNLSLTIYNLYLLFFIEICKLNNEHKVCEMILLIINEKEKM